MKLAPALAAILERLNRFSMRERIMVFGAVLAVLFVLWSVALMDPLEARRSDLLAELSTLQESIEASASAAEALTTTHPVAVAVSRQRSLQSELKALDAQLVQESAGLVEPSRMTEAIRDVLSRQAALRLVSLKNLPAVSLAEAGSGAQPGAGPYLHPVEIVIEGRYLDTLLYVQALEHLPWRFYWRRLELQTLDYPVNRVRIELGTLSMEKEWIGI